MFVMMTINISLPDKQTRMIDTLIASYGFSNKDEFFRAVLNKLLNDAHLLKKTLIYPKAKKKIKEEKLLLLFDKGKKEYLTGKLQKLDSLQALTK